MRPLRPHWSVRCAFEEKFGVWLFEIESENGAKAWLRIDPVLLQILRTLQDSDVYDTRSDADPEATFRQAVLASGSPTDWPHPYFLLALSGFKEYGQLQLGREVARAARVNQ